MKRVLLINPMAIDLRELARPSIRDQYEVIECGAYDRDHPEHFNAQAFIDETVQRYASDPPDGVLATHDYPAAIIASALASRLDLPSPSIALMLRTQHKYSAREDQQRLVPHATPNFTLLDPLATKYPDLDYPLFVKPVKSFFSILAAKVHSETDLRQLLHSKAALHHVSKFVRPFNNLLAEYAPGERSASYFVGEEALKGIQVTLEGYATERDVFIFGIVDSVLFPGTISFERFEYPSQLPSQIQIELQDIAIRLIAGIGYRSGLFNIEFFYDPGTRRISIIECNTRMAPQFSDLYEKVDGTSSYEVALNIATGQTPHFVYGAGKHETAISYNLRTFHDQRVVEVPSQSDLAALHHHFPDATLSLMVKPGERLGDHLQDLQSFKYGTLNLGGSSRADVQAKYKQARELLPFVFDD